MVRRFRWGCGDAVVAAAMGFGCQSRRSIHWCPVTSHARRHGHASDAVDHEDHSEEQVQQGTYG